MSLKLKPLSEQVIFITAATSGIGLATIHRAVEQGAKVFMVDVIEEDLEEIQMDLRSKGYETAYAVAEVSEYDQLAFAADSCIRTFGCINTFINNVGVVPIDPEMTSITSEFKKIFDGYFWGIVNGCIIALSLMCEEGGVIMNVGNGLSHVSSPIQSLYVSSKQAVIAYSHCLRKELALQKLPLALCLIMPEALDTPYDRFTDSIERPLYRPPIYDADVIAQIILKYAERPGHDVGVWPIAELVPQVSRFLPKLRKFLLRRNPFQRLPSIQYDNQDRL